MGLISQIKRRNVHRMAVLYVAVAWLIVQVVGELKDLASLPDWVGPALLGLLALGFPIAIAFSWFYEITPEGVALEKDIEGDRSITHAGGRRLDFIVISLLSAAVLVFAYDKWWSAGQPITSLAVLPINPISTDPVIGYMAEGMTETLNNELGRIEALRVISIQSVNQYKATDKKLPVIANELNVDAILEGSIQGFDNKLKIVLRLIDGRSDHQIWGGSFDSEEHEIRTLLGEVAQTVAAEINISLAPEDQAHFARDRELSPEAFRYWTIGNHFLKNLDDQSFQKALEAFSLALEKDSDYAEAYAGIAYTYLYEGSWAGTKDATAILPLAKEAAEKALRLDSENAQANFALGMIRRYEWDWTGAERAFRDGSNLNPNDSIGLTEFANFLIAVGRIGEAIETATRAVEIDPISSAMINELGWAYFVGGYFESALEEYQRSLRMDPDLVQTNMILADFYIHQQQLDNAAPHLEKLEEVTEFLPGGALGILGLHYGLIGQKEKTGKILASLKEMEKSEYVPETAFAYLYLGLEDHDEALNWLEAAFEARDPSLFYIQQLWYYDTLRSDVRFQRLVDGMRFPTNKDGS